MVGNDEPQDLALKRFRREVMTAGLVQEVRSRFGAGVLQFIKYYYLLAIPALLNKSTYLHPIISPHYPIGSQTPLL